VGKPEQVSPTGTGVLETRGDGGQAFAGWDGEAAPLGEIGGGARPAGWPEPRTS